MKKASTDAIPNLVCQTCHCEIVPLGYTVTDGIINHSYQHECIVWFTDEDIKNMEFA